MVEKMHHNQIKARALKKKQHNNNMQIRFFVFNSLMNSLCCVALQNIVCQLIAAVESVIAI